MNEITALNSEYSAIVPNKSLEIPQQLKVVIFFVILLRGAILI